MCIYLLYMEMDSGLESSQARRFLVSIRPWVEVVYLVSLTLFSKQSGWFYTFHTRHVGHLLM